MAVRVVVHDSWARRLRGVPLILHQVSNSGVNGMSALITTYFREKERVRLTVSCEGVPSTTKFRGREPRMWNSRCPMDIPTHTHLLTDALARSLEVPHGGSDLE